MDLPRYEYRPLNGPDEIRVLELSTTKSRIQTRIRHVSISSHRFEALSYMWGKPDHAREAIVVDELGEAIGWIPLTKNLGDAMCGLRDAEELTRKVFWIDQVCINQQDEKEKGHQVGMMSQIFTKAERVITYLGPAGPAEEEEQGFRLLMRIYGDISKSTWDQIYDLGHLHPIRNWMADHGIHYDAEVGTGADEPDDKNEVSRRYVEQGWEWLVRAAYGEWTQRLWIVQEQLLNKEITTLRGNRLIDWTAITAIIILFAVDYFPQQYVDMAREQHRKNTLRWEDVEWNIYGIWWDRYARLARGTDYTWSTLLHNLEWYQSLKCEDARDRVYAILAISQDLGLKPDYTPQNTCDNLSKTLSVLRLETEDNLKLLTFAFLWPRSSTALPSWCLSLDSITNTDSPHPIYGTYAPHPKSADPHLARFSIESPILTLKGRVLDYASCPDTGIGLDEDPENVPEEKFCFYLVQFLPHDLSIEDIASLLRTITATTPWSPPNDAQLSEDENNAFHLWAYLRRVADTLADLAERAPRPTQELLERCERILTGIKAFAPNIAHAGLQTPASGDSSSSGSGDLASGEVSASEEDLLGDEDWVSVDDSDSEEEGDSGEYLAAERMVEQELWFRRRVGRTREGRFYNAVDAVQEGDAIVALQGADRLYVIRLVGDAYNLIGDIFVDGLMNGEAYEGQDPDEVDYDIMLA